MNLHRAHTEILILAVAAVLVLLLSVSFKAPQPQAVEPQVSSQVHVPVTVQPAAVSVVPASFQTVSQTVSVQTTGDWVRADTVEAPVKQTRWVF